MTDATVIRGRAEIAAFLERSERTVTEWVKRGLLTVRRAGPFPNSPLAASRAELERVKRMLTGEDE